MFKAAQAPKEGRLPHRNSISYSGLRGPKGQQRQGTIALIGLLCFFAWFFLLRSDGTADLDYSRPTTSINRPHVPLRTSPQESTFPNKASESKDGSTLGQNQVQVPGQQPLNGKGATDSEQEADEEDSEPQPVPPSKGAATDGSKGSDHGPAPSNEKWKPRPNFERDLAKIIDLMPDDVYMRELIRPIDSGGKERMRELGLRTRQYKKYFNAWEKLHIAESDFGEVAVRDDVIQYLHSGLVGEKSSGDVPSLAGASLANTIVTYEAFRTFLGKFAQILFPFTAPYFSDHMSLHSHFKKGGRGIVLTAGDDQAPYLMTGIHTLRKLGCNLPVEVHYLGDSDLGEDYRADLEVCGPLCTCSTTTNITRPCPES
jgi:hypothetical protein